VRVGAVPETVADCLAADGLTGTPRVTGHWAWAASRPLKGPAAKHPEQEGAGGSRDLVLTYARPCCEEDAAARRGPAGTRPAGETYRFLSIQACQYLFAAPLGKWPPAYTCQVDALGAAARNALASCIAPTSSLPLMKSSFAPLSWPT